MRLSLIMLPCVLMALLVGSVPAAAAPVASEFGGLVAGARPQGITAGPDGNLWFTENTGNRIGRISPSGVVTEFATGISPGANPEGITAGPDGNLWFTENVAGRIGRITPAGAVSEFAAGITPGSFPVGITTGPDGNLWFTEQNVDQIGRITPDGAVTEFAAGISPGAGLRSIVTGPDGNLWFTELTGDAVGRITTSGTITEFTAGLTPGADPEGIAGGPDGNLWFTERVGNRIGRVTPAGAIHEFTAGLSPGSGPRGIVAGPDGNLWFAQRGANRIGRIATDGTITELTAGISAASGPFAIAAGPDGLLWFTERDGDRIGRIATDLSAPATGNLLRNPGFEDAAGAFGDGGLAPVPSWVTIANATGYAFGAGPGLPGPAEATPMAGGDSFLFGGVRTGHAGTPGTSNALQDVDVAAHAASIDAGAASTTLAGWIGGRLGDADQGSISATFLDAHGAALGAVSIAPVTPAARNYLTTFVRRTASGTLPARTRTVRVTATAEKDPAGTANDAYFDNLSLTLALGAVTPDPPAYPDPPAPPSSAPRPPRAAPTATRPRSLVNLIRASHSPKRFTGTARGAGVVSRVELTIVRLGGTAHVAAAKGRALCWRLGTKGVLIPIAPAAGPKAGGCVTKVFLRARGSKRWSYTLRRPLPKGRYVITSRATDAAGTRETAIGRSNRRVFTVR